MKARVFMSNPLVLAGKRYLPACAAILLLASCNDPQTKKSPTQVAAKVNGEEISIHQLNVMLSRVQAGQITTPEQMRREVLDKLIDQQVLYAQGVDKKVDRDPKVMLLVESARREIVARAYMDSLLAMDQSKPSTSEVHQYYVENPALFSQRKIYNMEEIVLPVMPGVAETLTHMAEEGKGFDEVSRYLAAKQVQFSSAGGVRTAEQIPLDLLVRVAAIPDGKTALIESNKRYYVIRVLSSQLAPISETEARRGIEVFLANQQVQRTVALEVKRLKANARIEYLGDFAKTVKDDSGATVVALKPERISQ